MGFSMTTFAAIRLVLRQQRTAHPPHAARGPRWGAGLPPQLSPCVCRREGGLAPGHAPLSLQVRVPCERSGERGAAVF